MSLQQEYSVFRHDPVLKSLFYQTFIFLNATQQNYELMVKTKCFIIYVDNKPVIHLGPEETGV